MNDADVSKNKTRYAEIRDIEKRIVGVNKWLQDNIHHKDWDAKIREYNNLIIKRDAIEDDIDRVKGKYRNVEIMNSISINPNYNTNGRR